MPCSRGHWVSVARTLALLGALPVLFACTGNPPAAAPPPPPLTPAPGVLGIRVWMPALAELTYPGKDCATYAETIKKNAMDMVQAALSRAGFSIVTDPNGRYDAKGRVSLGLDGTCAAGLVTIAVEPGATVALPYSLDWATDLARSLQEAPQILALKTHAPEPAASAGTPGVAPASAGQSPPKAAVVPATAAFLPGGAQNDTIALIVGVERYRDVPGATGARADAETFARLAQSSLGVAAGNAHVLVDDRAAKSDIEKELAWLQGNVPPNGRVLFYFAGHGAPDASAGTPYLVPYDGDPKTLGSTAIPLARVLESLSKTKAREVLAITDACFAGAGGRSVLPPGARPLVRVKDAPSAPRVALFAATSGAQISGPAPGGGGGLFTKLLVEAIGTGQGDIDGDGRVSLHELREWVVPRVAREAKKDSRDQTPSLTLGKGAVEGDFVVATGLGHH